MILVDGVRYRLWKPQKEEMLETMVREHSKDIWGKNSVYFGKKQLRTEAGIISIPDGYVVVFESPPLWYVVEVELSSHHVYEHIVPQISKFAAGVTKIENQRVIVDLIDTRIGSDDVLGAWVKEKVAPLEVYKFLTALIAKPARLAIVIDEKTKELDEVITQLHTSFEAVETMEFKTFQREGCGLAVHAHLFELLHQARIAKEGEVIPELTPPELSKGNLLALPDGLCLIRASKPDGIDFLLKYKAWGFVNQPRKNPRYLALYVSDPISAVKYLGEVGQVLDPSHPNSPVRNEDREFDTYKAGRKVMTLKQLWELERPIPKGTRGGLVWPLYCSLREIAKASDLDDLLPPK